MMWPHSLSESSIGIFARAPLFRYASYSQGRL